MRPPNLPSTAHYIAWHARESPQETAIVEDDLFVTYRRMAEHLVHCVHAIEALGIRPDTLVGVEYPRRYPHLLILLACEVIGAATVSLTPGDGDDILSDCDAVLASAAFSAASIVLPPDFLATLQAGPPISADDLSLLEHPVVPDRAARIARTSGTTGVPKAMAISFQVQQIRVTTTVADTPRVLPSRPRMLCLYHLATGPVHRRVLTILQLGGTVLFTVGRFITPLIEAGAVHYAIFTAGDIERTLRDARPPPTGHTLHVNVFGAPFTPRLRQLVRERLHASTENFYSSNETNGIAVIGEDNIGRLCGGVEVKIVDELGREKPHGEAGIIRVRSASVVSGYLNDPALTAACFIDGWFQTSDIGFVPEPGKLAVLGRADDMLNIGGVKVAPGPIEAQMKAVEGIGDAVVMSIASANDVGILVAAVEIDSDEIPQEIFRGLRAILLRHVGVFEVMPMRRFPRTESGKVIRHEIEAAFRRR